MTELLLFIFWETPHRDCLNERVILINEEGDRGRERQDTQYCCCPTQQAILSARATTVLTAESQPLFSCCSPCSLPISPLSIWGRTMRWRCMCVCVCMGGSLAGNLVNYRKRLQPFCLFVTTSMMQKGKKLSFKEEQLGSQCKRMQKWREGGKKKIRGKIRQTNMHTHTSAIITDTWHNTSLPINITPQICIGTVSHSLL